DLVLAPGGHEVVAVEFAAPAEAGAAVLTVELRAGERVVHTRSQDLRIVARRPLAVPPGFRLALHDPSGTLAAALARAGVRAAPLGDLAGLDALDAAKVLVIIGPGAFAASAASVLPVVGGAPAGAARLAPFVARGGRALVCAQDTLEPTGLGVALVDHPSTMAHALAPDDPLLAGLTAEDLSFWRPGHYVSRRELRRPAGRGARTVVATGGAQGLDQALVLRLPVGAGEAVLLQALVAEKLGTVPGARRLFENALRALAAFRPPAGRTFLVTGRREFTDALAGMGVRAEPLVGAPAGGTPASAPLAPADLVMLDGGGVPARDSVQPLAFFLGRGGTVYWHAPEADAFAALCAAAGAGPLVLAPARGPVIVKGAGRGVLAGVAREDLAFRGANSG
ncbi:MAG: hypothetical protein AAB368_06545, partial [bacterium]